MRFDSRLVTGAPKLNRRVSALRCIRCDSRWPVADYPEGCETCLGDGTPASLAPDYGEFPDRLPELAGRTGAARYADWLVYDAWPSLGEGGTPIVELDLAQGLGLSPLLIKNEGANPTGSHKDRMSMLAVARALDIGATTVIAASSGNAGASIAAYAGRAGLECVVVTTQAIGPNWRRAIEAHGARLVATTTSHERWRYVQRRVEKGGWYPVTNYLIPPVGSNLFGVDGYRTIAFELEEQVGADRIDHVIVPTARADLLWGIARGFKDLERSGLTQRSPRVHAVEPFFRIAGVLQGSDHRSQFVGTTSQSSIAGTTVTYQALNALDLCGGTAMVARDEEVRADQQVLARCGFYVELASAAPLSATRALLRKGVIKSRETVVLVVTSHGYKEPAADFAPIPVVEDV